MDFISERQLAAGRGREYRLIVLPEVTHLPRAAFDALASLGMDTRIAVIGKSPEKDQYHAPLPEDGAKFLGDRAVKFPYDVDAEKALWPQLMSLLEDAHALPEVRVVDAGTGQPVWGVEWLAGEIDGREIVNIIDLLNKPVSVNLISRRNVIYERTSAEDPTLKAVDLLSLGGKSEVKALLPMTPVLAEVAR